MLHQKIFKFSIIATALMVANAFSAQHTYHFSDNSTNNTELKLKYDEEVILSDDRYTPFDGIDVILSDVALDKNGAVIDAINNNTIELIAYPEFIPTSVIGLQLLEGGLTNTQSGSIDALSDVSNVFSIFYSPPIPSKSFGISINSKDAANIHNQGMIKSKSINELNNRSGSYGINATSNTGHLAISNNGIIIAESLGEFSSIAKAITSQKATNTIKNQGQIKADATDTNTALAVGIEIAPQSLSSRIQQIENQGNITALAISDEAHSKGISVTGAESYIKNSGLIHTTSGYSSNPTLFPNSAYGIEAKDAVVTINSTGKIATLIEHSSGNKSGYDIAAFNSKVYIEQYQLTLSPQEPWLADKDSAIFLGNKQQEGQIIVHAGKKEDGFIYGADYALVKSNSKRTPPISVMGNTALLTSISPDFIVKSKLKPDGGISSISLNYAPTTSHSGISLQAQRSAMALVSDTVNSRLHSQLIDNNRNLKKNVMFITPYGGTASHINSPSGYKERRTGVLLGYDHHLANGALGWHAGVENAKTDFSGQSKGHNEDRQTYLLGVQGGAILNNGMFISASSTWFTNKISHNDKNYYLSTNYQKQNYRSQGLYTDTNIGMRWNANTHLIITPMVGVNHLWQQRDAYSLKSSDRQYTYADILYSKYHDQSTSMQAKVRFDAVHAVTGNVTLQPYITVGFQKSLHGKDIKTVQGVTNGPSVALTTKSDNFINTLDAGLIINNKNGFNTDVHFSGRGNKKGNDYTGWINFKYQF